MSVSIGLVTRIVSLSFASHHTERRHTKPCPDLYSKNMVMFPANISSNHWIVFVAHMRLGHIDVYDSFGPHNALPIKHKIVFALGRFLNSRYRASTPMIQPTAPGHRWNPCFVEGARQQTNGFDCALFVILVAEFMALEYPFTFTQETAGNFRSRVMLALTEGRIDHRGGTEQSPIPID